MDTTPQKDTTHPCGVCDKPTHQNHLKCSKCRKRIHIKEDCSRVKYSRIKKIMKRTSWKCINCTNPKRKHGMKKKCSSCKGGIREGYDFYKCSMCKRNTHKKQDCSEISPAEAARLDRKTWHCPSCIQEEKEREERQSRTDHEGTKIKFRHKSKENAKTSKTTINLLQWNADSLNSKINELRLFLKKIQARHFYDSRN